MSAQDNPNVVQSSESPRGCGYRKPGGVYLVASGLGHPCGRMPLRCGKCPCCGAGIKPVRSWTWIDLQAFLKDAPPCWQPEDGHSCTICPMGGSVKRAGLLWIGTQFYRTPAEFALEAARMGVSRRIPAVPRDFKLGETWVLLAHRDHPDADDPSGKSPMIFHAFQPVRVEKVLRGNESDEEIDAIVKRGMTPVLVKRIGEQTEIPAATADSDIPETGGDS